MPCRQPAGREEGEGGIRKMGSTRLTQVWMQQGAALHALKVGIKRNTVQKKCKPRTPAIGFGINVRGALLHEANGPAGLASCSHSVQMPLTIEE